MIEVNQKMDTSEEKNNVLSLKESTQNDIPKQEEKEKNDDLKDKFKEENMNNNYNELNINEKKGNIDEKNQVHSDVLNNPILLSFAQTNQNIEIEEPKEEKKDDQNLILTDNQSNFSKLFTEFDKNENNKLKEKEEIKEESKQNDINLNSIENEEEEEKNINESNKDSIEKNIIKIITIYLN